MSASISWTSLDVYYQGMFIIIFIFIITMLQVAMLL